MERAETAEKTGILLTEQRLFGVFGLPTTVGFLSSSLVGRADVLERVLYILNWLAGKIFGVVGVF